MALDLGAHEGAERNDLPAAGPGCLDRMGGERLADAATAQGIGHAGVSTMIKCGELREKVISASWPSTVTT